jgi:putative ABC transport system permease protein
VSGAEGWRGRRGRDEADDEIRHHILERADALVEQGWSRGDALREAERRFGDVDRIHRDMRRGRRSRPGELVSPVFADVRYALRGVRGSPCFALALVATLALGIGAASAIFAVVDALLLRPLPYAHADRLIEVNHARWQVAGYTPGTTTSRVRGWQEAASALVDGWVVWRFDRFVRTDGPAAEELRALAVTPGADTLLGIPLLLGRGFTPEDARVGSADVVVLGRGYFNRLGGDPLILGSTIRLESGPVTVVGVLRGGARFPTWGGETDLWLPIRDDFTAADRPLPNVGGLWARLRPGITRAQAQARANVLSVTLQEREPLDGGWAVDIAPVGAYRATAEVERALWTLSATVAAIFLIAWVNGINLLLVRTTARSRELAVRAAIGGTRRRVLRQLLIEGVVWGVLGGVAALGVAVVAVRAVARITPWIVLWSSPHAIDVQARMLVFTFGASLVVGTVLGLVPALHMLRQGVLSPLARGRDDAPDRRRLRRGLVTAQVALSMTLLAAAGLFVNGFARLIRVDAGYEYERIALATIGPSETRYPDAAARAVLFERLEERLEAHPMVDAVTRVDGRGFRSGAPLQAEGAAASPNQPHRVPTASIPPDYIGVMGAELVAGRAFEAADVDTDAVIIDLDLARFLWRENPVGRRFRLGDDGDWMTVVGVVRELRLMGRDQREGPYQILHPASRDRANGWVDVAVRTAGDPRAVLSVVRDAVRAIDPEQTIWRLRTGADALAEEEAEARFVVTLMSVLAAIAVALAAVGLYGVLAYTVSRRSRELAVRIAVGADASRLRSMVLAEGLAVAAVGIGLGIAGTLAASRALANLLYDVQPYDPTTLAATATLFLAIAAGASLLPARRAMRVNPAETLRRD